MKKTIGIAILLCLFVLQLPAQDWWKKGITGEGPVVERDLELADFDAIRLSTNGKVYLRQGNQQSVRVKGQQNIIDNLKKEVNDGSWKISFERPVRRHAELAIYITMPSLRHVGVSGSGSIIGESKFTGLGDLKTHISGSGRLELEAESRNLSSHISGSGSMRLAGSTGQYDIHISGSGKVYAYDLDSSDCEVHISGSGDCEVQVQESLEVRISGSGDVFYRGRPRVTSRISGSGDVVGKS